jgi:hypothetical protein
MSLIASAMGCEAGRADAVRAARLHAPDDAPLDPDVDDRHAADERDDADRAQQPRNHVDQPGRPAGVIDQVEDGAAQVREVADVPPVIGDDRQQAAHRSTSPTLMSMLPSVTIASAIVCPIVISGSTLRLISEGDRTCQRYGAGSPSLE